MSQNDRRQEKTKSKVQGEAKQNLDTTRENQHEDKIKSRQNQHAAIDTIRQVR
jgi:hypothetical protein